jgi:predicted dehydrogenase
MPVTLQAKEVAVPLRIIQAGLGGWGRNWYQNILRPSEEVAVTAWVDADEAALETARQATDAPLPCFTTLEAALGAAPAEAVLITAALPGHVPLALAALAAGKHVLVEKPFAPTLAEARQVVDAAAAAGRLLMVSQNYRFYPAPRTIAALVRDGTLGEVGMIAIDFRRAANRAPREGHRHYALPHPLLMDMAIHHLDLLRMVVGREPTSVACHAWNPPWSNFQHPAAAAATITFDGGLAVSYRGSWVSPGQQTPWAGVWRMELAGGEVSWTSRGGGARQADDDRVTVRPPGKAARRVALPQLPALDRAGSLAAFAHAISTGHEPESSGRDNLGSIALMHAMVESAASGLTVPVSRAAPDVPAGPEGRR